MASVISETLQSSMKKSSQHNQLDLIANFMDSILNNMKSQIKDFKKNKNIDSSPFSSGSQNLSIVTYQNGIPSKSLLSKKPEAIIKNVMDAPLKNRSKQSSVKQKNSSVKRTPSKKPSIIKPPSNSKPPSRGGNPLNDNHSSSRPNNAHKVASPRKMCVVYQENDKFVTKSLSSMLKHTNQPKITTEKVAVRKSLGKSISNTSRISKRFGSSKILTNNRSKSEGSGTNKAGSSKQSSGFQKTKTVIQEALTKQLSKNVSKSRPMSSCSTRNTNKNKTGNFKNIKEDTHQKQLPGRKKIVPTICPPATDPPIVYPKRSGENIINTFMNPGSSKTPNNFNVILDNVPMSADGKPIKFMKNSDIKKKQEDSQKNTNEMGDNSLKFINEKLQDIFQKIREEKDATAGAIKECLVEKFGTPVKISSQRPDTITVIKSANTNIHNNNNNNSNNSCNVTALKPANNNVNNNNFNKIVTNNNNNNVVVNKQNQNNNNNKQNFVNNNNNNKQIVNYYNNNKQNFNNNNNRQIGSKTTSNVQVRRSILKVTSNINQRKISNTNCRPKPSIHSAIVPRPSNFSTNVVIPRKLNCLTPMEIIQDYVALVNRAKKDRKTYTVCGNFYSIRRAFSERGWIEKLRINVQDDRENLKQLENMSNFELVEQMGNKDTGEKYRRMFISKLLAGHQVDFYWDYQTNPFNVLNDKNKRTLINRFPFNATRSYTSKAGLSDALKEAYWFYTEGYSNILFPRTYNLAHDEELSSFIDDFRLTAAISLLVWVNKNTDKPLNIISPNGTIPVSVFNFATLQCYNFIKHKEHKDLDSTIPVAREAEWEIFLEKFYKVIHQGQHFKESDLINAPLLLDQSKYILGKIRRYIPYVDLDGNMNLWLLKPNNGSRGCGIHVCRTLKYALDTIHQRKDIKYVVQKYIEKPLLIHNTKFDIRQYFLVTCFPNLQVWLYKDNYLRFSSQMYDLSKLHESIHLTNNSIQCRYRNNTNRSNVLPEQNMWHSDTFRKYLSDIGQPYAWRNIIYKGIKECLVGLFMLCQDKIITRVNSFELCGADFMLADDYRPYLIEINSRPALYPSTKITAQMCPKVLEDVIKVTIDYQRNPRAPTGNFELIYRDNYNIPPIKDINSLSLEGASYSKMSSKQTPQEIKNPVETVALKKEEDLTGYNIRQILNIDPNKVRKDVKNTLEKILAIIHSKQNELDKNADEEKRLQFRMMLSEFVDIISGLKAK